MPGYSLSNRLLGTTGLSIGRGLSLGNGLFFNGFNAPALNLNFAAMTSGTDLSRAGVTFSRVSNATYYDSTGILTYAPNNLFTWSQDFTNVVWSKTRSTISASTFVAPDGTSTAQKLIPNVGVTDADLRPFTTTTTVTGRTEIYSIYAKAVEYNGIAIQDFFLGNSLSYFNLNTGVATAGSAVSAGITAVGNGWYRCWIVFTPTGTSGYPFFRVAQNGSVTLPAANGTDGVLMWGAQREVVTYQTTPGFYNLTTSAAYYGPRFDYDPATLAARGLLIEEARTNRLLPSNSFTSNWTFTSATVTASAGVSPDGTSNANLLIPSNATAQHFTTNNVFTNVTGFTTVSVFVKAREYSRIVVYMDNTAGTSLAYAFDLNTLAVTNTRTAASWSSPSASVVSIGNGWYRLSVSGNWTGASTPIGLRLSPYPSGATFDGFGLPNAYAANGTDAIFIYGAQMEAGAFATSYIPTAASSVARSADSASMTGTNFSSWYNQSEGTFVLNGARIATVTSSYSGGFPIWFSANDGGSTVSIRAFGSFAANRDAYNINGTDVAYNALVAANVFARLSVAYKQANDAAGTLNGSTAATGSPTVPNSLIRLDIGNRPDGARNVNGWIRSIVYYRTRLPNVTLQWLTQ